jgi:hypothetical protein
MAVWSVFRLSFLVSFGTFLQEYKVVSVVNVIVYTESRTNKTNKEKNRNAVKDIRTRLKD